MHCFRANTWYRSENPRAVCVFVSPVLIPSSTNRRVDHFHPTRYLSHLPTRLLYCMPLRKIITQRNFLCLCSKIIRKASFAHHIFFSFKKRPNISLYVAYSRSLIWFFEDFTLLIWQLNFTQNNLCTTSDKNTNFNISKNLLREVGISNSLCSRTVWFTIFKRQIKAKGTHLSRPWSAFPAHVVQCGSQPTAPTCVVWSWHLKDSPRQWPMAMPCWWAPVRAATARVIWLCACVR